MGLFDKDGSVHLAQEHTGTLEQDTAGPHRAVPPHSVLICLLGSFRLLKWGKPMPLRDGGKVEALLSSLALCDGYRASRHMLLGALWPDSEVERAVGSLNTLLHSLRSRLADALAGEPPVLYAQGGYELNVAAGVTVDIACFDALAAEGERHLRNGRSDEAIRACQAAVGLYQGDVCTGESIRTLIERERLRTRYLTLLAHLADQSFATADYAASLGFALRLLLHDPCREDAHRRVMCCHVRLGARAEALRQYLVCREILDREFGAVPEPATETLFARVRLDPASV